MDTKTLFPYLLPLLVLFIMYRRIGRAQKVRVNRLWLRPAFIGVASGLAIYASGVPTLPWMGAYLLAAVVGVVTGYYRASHTHLSVHPETGDVQATQTPIATAIIMGLFVVKLSLNLIFPQLNGGRRPSPAAIFTPDTVDAMQAASQASHTATTINYATDTLLIFSTMMFVTSAAETWLRATRLLAAHRGEKGEVSDQ